MENMLKRVEKVDERVKEGFDVLGREIRIQCPSKVMNYLSYVKAKDAGVLQQKVPVQLGPPRRVSIRASRALSPVNAISTVEQGFVVDLTRLRRGDEYLLEVEYPIEDPDFVDDMVSRTVSRESPSQDKTEYWMYAQLRELEELRTRYGVVDLRDMDFFVNVDVHQDVDTTIPKAFRERLEAITALTRTADVNQKFREWSKIRSTTFGSSGGGDLDTLSDIFRIFVPENFKSYVNVSKDFYYFDNEPGQNFLDFPLISIPKFVRVISRTDLGLDKPAAEGLLTFKRQDMLDEIRKHVGG